MSRYAFRPTQTQTPFGGTIPEPMTGLPLELLRSSNVTRDPEAIARGIEEFEVSRSGAVRPVILPQRTAFASEYKRLPGGPSRGSYADPLASATSIVEAFAVSGTMQGPVVEPSAPMYPIEQAAWDRGAGRYAEHLAWPSEEVPVSMTTPVDQPLLPPPSALATTMMVTGVRAEAERKSAFVNTLNSAQAAIDGVYTWLFG